MQQTITLANTDPDLCCHVGDVAPLSYTELKSCHLLILEASLYFLNDWLVAGVSFSLAFEAPISDKLLQSCFHFVHVELTSLMCWGVLQ